MLQNEALGRVVARVKGMSRSLLASADEAKRKRAETAKPFIALAETALDKGDEWRAFGLLCFVSGRLTSDDSREYDMPWVFGEKETGATGELGHALAATT